MRPYELVVVISPEVQEEGVTQMNERVGKYITDLGGEIETQNLWGKRRLAYPIKRFIEGTYVLTHFQLDPALSSNLEASLRVNEEVLRHILIRREN